MAVHCRIQISDLCMFQVCMVSVVFVEYIPGYELSDQFVMYEVSDPFVDMCCRVRSLWSLWVHVQVVRPLICLLVHAP